MSKKKISGYTIFLDQKLGKGAYGIVSIRLFRSTRGRKIQIKELLLSK